jgi:hypothetical protein
VTTTVVVRGADEESAVGSVPMEDRVWTLVGVVVEEIFDMVGRTVEINECVLVGTASEGELWTEGFDLYELRIRLIRE